VFLAWCAHAFTALGCLFGFFAIPAVARGDYRTAFLCLVIAAVIDSLDGTFARAVRVREVLPDFDGRMLDYVFDFLNFVITPAFVLYQTGLAGRRFSAISVIAIVLVSSYHYGNMKALTADLHFLGFPALWNLVIFYLYVLALGAWWNLAIVALFCVLHFVPIQWVSISRTRRQRPLIVVATAGAAVTAAAISILLPVPPRVLVWVSFACCASLIVLSVIHTLFPSEAPA
jgi:phosphatidylcholine synthase